MKKEQQKYTGCWVVGSNVNMGVCVCVCLWGPVSISTTANIASSHSKNVVIYLWLLVRHVCVCICMGWRISIQPLVKIVAQKQSISWLMKRMKCWMCSYVFAYYYWKFFFCRRCCLVMLTKNQKYNLILQFKFCKNIYGKVYWLAYY